MQILYIVLAFIYFVEFVLSVFGVLEPSVFTQSFGLFFASAYFVREFFDEMTKKNQ